MTNHLLDFALKLIFKLLEVAADLPNFVLNLFTDRLVKLKSEAVLIPLKIL
jgi:hypothetical protein